ncbi:TetR/AcrR family transcriptional regulator [Caulobacter sp. SSI4214]|uniref:TetR/AcrR family transcriptional regulator n=1 Tax=Caulobacter sp. SSI4214 TaxID=2575739 RepID=UPI00143B39A0|nr:TetR/AcrR family transcriptional regulator [Caulobacter sp. SSI4214]
MTARLEADILQVLRAAMALVSADGLSALTLRPLAERLGTTVSILSYKFGRKDDLVAAIIDAAREEDSAFLDLWLARIRAVRSMTPAIMAEFADSILDDMARGHAIRGQFYCELLQGAASRPEIAAPLGLWRAQRLAFWRAATERLERPDLAETLHAYSADEVVHGLALGDQAAYRWLRRLGLKRLCGGLVAAEGDTDGELFTVFHAALGDLLMTPDGRYQAAPMSEWQARIAGHISALIIDEGADAVTHRAVAKRAGVASSTLAYHFPRQDDLLRSGLDDVIIRLQGHVDRPASPVSTSEPNRSREEIARATFAVALAATRNASLRGIAADMRRRRGENLYVYLKREGGGATPFDLLSAQVMSITSIGQLMLTAGEVGGAGADFELIGRMRTAALAAGPKPPREYRTTV